MRSLCLAFGSPWGREHDPDPRRREAATLPRSRPLFSPKTWPRGAGCPRPPPRPVASPLSRVVVPRVPGPAHRSIERGREPATATGAEGSGGPFVRRAGRPRWVGDARARRTAIDRIGPTTAVAAARGRTPPRTHPVRPPHGTVSRGASPPTASWGGLMGRSARRTPVVKRCDGRAACGTGRTRVIGRSDVFQPLRGSGVA